MSEKIKHAKDCESRLCDGGICTCQKEQAVRYIEVSGEDEDLKGLVECVERRFGLVEGNTIEDFTEEDPRVAYRDDSDAMAHAFNRGLAMYVLGFVDSKVDGTLRVVEHVE